MPPTGGSKARVLEDFRGEYNYPGNQQSVPWGRSPAAQNMQFWKERTYSRSAFVQLATFTGRCATVKEWASLDAMTRRLLVLTDQGALWKETPMGSYSFVQIAANLVEAANQSTLKMNSVTAFGREYMAFAQNGVTPATTVQAFDDTNIDPVAPTGPAKFPSVVAWNGGTNIQAGFHSFRVCYVTRSGYITMPGPPVALSFNGGTGATVSNLPIGPAYVVARIIVATPECSGNYYYIASSSMVVNDNTTTSVNIDFQDSTLQNGTPVSVSNDPTTDKLNLLELAPQALVGFYNNRLVFTGERNAYLQYGDDGFRNMSFRAGFTGNSPDGWNVLSTGVTPGSAANAVGGMSVRITGDGATQVGCMENFSAPTQRWKAGVQINFRVRMIASAGGLGGTVMFYMSTFGTAFGTLPGAVLSFNLNTLSSTEWRTFTGTLLTNTQNTINVAAGNNSFRISGGQGGNVIPNGAWIELQNLEIYPATVNVNASLVRWSRSGLPEEVDGISGQSVIGRDDGQTIQTHFSLSGNYYFFKDRSIYRVRDDGASEPNLWPVHRVSYTVGSPSATGVGQGDGWLAVASRNGLWIFNGYSMKKVSGHYFQIWRRINWTARQTIWCVVDNEVGRISVGVPLDGASTPSTILDFEYLVDEGPLSEKMDTNRWFTSDGAGFLSAGFAERPDGSRIFMLGSDHSTGKLLRYDNLDQNHADYGTLGINSRYRTAYTPNPTGRQNINYVTASVTGSGTLGLDMYYPDTVTNLVTPQAPLSRTIANSSLVDMEWRMEMNTERAAAEFYTTSPGDWFGLQKVAIWLKPDILETRGITV